MVWISQVNFITSDFKVNVQFTRGQYVIMKLRLCPA